jgi:hypothetical protein
MKKFAANYLITQSGKFLKNGMVTIGQDGWITEITDTHGDLQEVAQLIFCNGILMADFGYIQTGPKVVKPVHQDEIEALIEAFSNDSPKLSSQKTIELCVQIQAMYNKMTIPEIMTRVTEFFMRDGRYIKQELAGLILLSGNDLVNLKFRTTCKIRRIN